jgi:ppGpp synthetase/RelA/SpoT-type nucleotidyltranferase
MATGKFTLASLTATLEREHGGLLSPRVLAVAHLAYEGHRGQFREARDGAPRVPFIVHPVGTALNVFRYAPRAIGLTEDLDTLVCVALAHDLLEDTRVEARQLESVGGTVVRRLVEAVTKPLTSFHGDAEQRNREFVARIRAAGSCAVFIKFCDSMHNLSRPSSTPPTLLTKAIKKAERDYLPMLRDSGLGEWVTSAYVEAIVAAQAGLQKIENEPPPKDLAGAIATCVAAASGKVLEFHDVESILNRICQASGVGTVHVSARAFSLVAAGVDDVPVRLTGSRATAIPLIGAATWDTAFVAPIQAAYGARSFIVAGFADAAAMPGWLTLPAFTVLTQFLAQRLIVSRSDRRGELAREAAALGVQVDVEGALRVGMEPLQLRQLERWRNRCGQAASNVAHVIRMVILNDTEHQRLAHQVRVESRVKSIDSIVRKFADSDRYAWPRFEEVEDIAGVRIICPIASELARLEQLLLSPAVQKAGVRPHPLFENPRRDYITHPTESGYRAIHLILECRSALDDEKEPPVPCELQLRTMLQDAWAVISHASVYHGGGRRRQDVNALRAIGDKLEELETLLGCLFETVNDTR